MKVVGYRGWSRGAALAIGRLISGAQRLSTTNRLGYEHVAAAAKVSCGLVEQANHTRAGSGHHGCFDPGELLTELFRSRAPPIARGGMSKNAPCGAIEPACFVIDGANGVLEATNAIVEVGERCGEVQDGGGAEGHAQRRP